MSVLRPVLLPALLGVVLLVSGCGSQSPPDVRGARSGVTSPEGIPVPTGEVTTAVPVLVLDDGDGPELCLGGALESLPPQCGGPPVLAWDWSEHEGEFESRDGVRWGEFVVRGTFDGTSIEPEETTPAADWTPSVDGSPEQREDDDPFRTTCPRPEGGWVVDAGRTGNDELSAAFAVSDRLPCYSHSFVDDAADRPLSEDVDGLVPSGAAAVADDRSGAIVNVAVTRDPHGAQAAIREVWGGGICVTSATRAAAELRRVQDAMLDVPGFLSSGTEGEQVVVDVVYDDGSLAERLDAEYGAGLVVVASALRDG